MKALLLIDIQIDFLPGGALAVPGGDEIIPVVNQLQPHFELIIATQDWHPAHHQSFASQHAGRSVFDTIDLNGLEQVLWPDHCVQATPGAELATALHPHKIEAIFRKGTDPAIDSYSGFYDNGRRKSTGLADYLRGKNVRQLYVAGLAADYCVYFSIKDALAEGFDAYLIEDATRAIHPAGLTQAKADIIAQGGKMIASHAVL